jgi:mannonate dehydratase
MGASRRVRSLVGHLCGALDPAQHTGAAAGGAAGAAGAESVPTITDIRAIRTAPYGARLVVVKVITSVPGLHGVGCATFTQRASAVALAVEEYLRPFLLGRRVSEIEDIWQASFVSSYWRSGPVLNNAISGVDQALWDICGKVAGMPVHDLLGGKARKAAPVYVHASGSLPSDPNPSEHFAQAKQFMAQGHRHIRLQYSGYGATEASGPAVARPTPDSSDGPTDQDGIYDPLDYLITTPKMFAYAREVLGEQVELIHDTHERLSCAQAVILAKSLEPYRLFFWEDGLPPEMNDHFRLIRQHSSVPIAMGELFVNVHEYLPLIQDRLIDFIRVHMSDIGGITPMRKLAALCEFFGVKIALHGPGDCSPVGMMANLAIDLASTAFGIQEFGACVPLAHDAFCCCMLRCALTSGHRVVRAAKDCFDPAVYTAPGSKNANAEVFPGLEQCRLHDSMFWPNDLPGLGIDCDEDAAARHPWPTDTGITGQGAGHAWTLVRR